MGFVAYPPSVVSIPYVDIFAQLLHRHLHHEGGGPEMYFLSDSRGLEPEDKRLLQKNSLNAHVLLVYSRCTVADFIDPMRQLKVALKWG